MQISFQLPAITDFIWRENLYDYVFDEDKYIVEFRENIKLLLLNGSSISYDSTYIELNLKHDIINFVSKYINSEKLEYRETAKYLVQILVDQFELLKYINYPNQDFMQKENWNYQAADYFMASIQIGVNLYTKITNDSSYERNYSYYELVDGRLLFNQLKDVYNKLRKLCKDDYSN